MTPHNVSRETIFSLRRLLRRLRRFILSLSKGLSLSFRPEDIWFDPND